MAGRDRLENHAREWVTWKLQGLDVPTALTDLHAAKVIRQNPDELLAKMAERKGEDEEPLDTTQPATLSHALGHAGLITHFDTETGFVPCHHEELIRDFARNSEGRFGPECPIQIWHRQGEDDYDSPYTVQFIYRDRCSDRARPAGALSRTLWPAPSERHGLYSYPGITSPKATPTPILEGRPIFHRSRDV